MARGRRIQPEHLPAAATSPLAAPAGREIPALLAAWVQKEVHESGTEPDAAKLYERFLELAEPPVLRAALEHCRHNRVAAAQMLGIHRATVRQKLRKYGIE